MSVLSLLSDELIDEFGEACKEAFRKQFTDKRKTDFSYRMSNIGKPLCQLQMEKNGAEQETMPYNFKMRNLFGDLIEAAAITIMKSSGIEVTDIQKKVKLETESSRINGTMDDSVVKDDTFGYVSQGYMYGEADKSDFAGWIVINKSTGEWCVTETPDQDQDYKTSAIETAKNNIKALKENKPFERCFEDIEETFYKKPTGNRILGLACSFCSYKRACWGETLQYLPQQQSKGKYPKWTWYTEVNNPRVDSDY